MCATRPNQTLNRLLQHTMTPPDSQLHVPFLVLRGIDDQVGKSEEVISTDDIVRRCPA
jgi:hypothetical protein